MISGGDHEGAGRGMAKVKRTVKFGRSSATENECGGLYGERGDSIDVTLLRPVLLVTVFALAMVGCSTTRQSDRLEHPSDSVLRVPPRAGEEKNGVGTTRPDRAPDAPLTSTRSRAGWIAYRDVWFEDKSAELLSSELGKIADIAHYLTTNPEHQAGIDVLGDPKDAALRSRRVMTIRDALVHAGVPSSKIRTVALGNPESHREHRVEVLLSSP
jgi:outer membrane protein OmpA-like peptidoglycan-associated protein